jgi:hypothetical protein
MAPTITRAAESAGGEAGSGWIYLMAGMIEPLCKPEGVRVAEDVGVEEWTGGLAESREGKHLERQIRAFHWVRLLSVVADRRAGSAGEREAAQRVEAWMHEIGLERVEQVASPGEPEPPWRIALHLAFGALGCAMGGSLGIALVALAAFSFRRDLGPGMGQLSRLLPSADTIHVLGRAGATDPRRRVILSAGLDAPRAGGIFSKRLTTWLGCRRRRSRAPLVWCERGLWAAAVVAGASLLQASGPVFAGAQLAVTTVLLIAAAAALEWGLASATPGANDDASGVAAMLTCGEQILSQLRGDTELLLVAGGGSHCGATGFREALDRHPEWRSDRTILLHFDRVGGGTLHYVSSEGAFERTAVSPRLREVARRLAIGGAYPEITPVDFVGETDARIASARGFHALSLVALEDRGAPSRDHASDDVPQPLDMETVIWAADFAAAIVVASWRGASDPLAIV